jgi:outer membrane protein OmpA-like peptidoglycan-associated protein
MMRGVAPLLVMLAFAAAPAPAQQPTTNTSYTTKILDLVYHVEDMSGNVQSMSGNVAQMAAKIGKMVGANKNVAVKVSRTEVRIELASDVLFDFDSADIRPKARTSLARIAKFIGNNAKGQVRILGYTDGKGSAEYNQGLSERRAHSVEAWFIGKDGLTHVDFATQGFGMRDPVAPNTKPDGSDDPQGRAKNRRVEIILRK